MSERGKDTSDEQQKREPAMQQRKSTHPEAPQKRYPSGYPEHGIPTPSEEDRVDLTEND
jgi:hypothetical protein